MVSFISVLIPHQSDHMNSFKCLVINKRDGSCSSFSGNDQVDFTQSAACLDPLYNVIWTFNSANSEISSYNVISSEARSIPGLESSVLCPELALPTISTCLVTRSQAAMHLLACLDTLTQAQDEKLTIVEENECSQAVHGKVYSREDFATASRFESEYIFLLLDRCLCNKGLHVFRFCAGFGGGWGYSDHSVEAVRFMADTDILLGGYGLFGGRGEYNAKIKVFFP